MRDFNFEGANTSAADIAGPRPVVVEELPESAIMDEAVREEVLPDDSASLRPFHAGQGDEDEEESSNLPKYLGAAAVIAILAVGGGLYAYQLASANQTPKPVAVKTTAPTNLASNQPAAPALPPAALPQENNAPATPAPAPVKSAGGTPAPVAAAPEQQASAQPSKPGVGIGPTDDTAINAPMTYTADNAPAPQQTGSSSEVAQVTSATPADQTAANPANQTAAVQQPVAAPDVGNNTQPTASVAQLPRHQVQPSIQPAQ